jgi:two-component system cell cycle response regulator DivK
MTPPDRIVLVVDDNEETRWLVADVLKRAGYVVLEAGDGQLALDIAQRNHPDLVLLDMTLPGMDGLEVTKRFKSNSALAAIPLVALSARRQPIDREQALSAGCARYVTKPCPPAMLRDVVASALAAALRADPQQA